MAGSTEYYIKIYTNDGSTLLKEFYTWLYPNDPIRCWVSDTGMSVDIPETDEHEASVEYYTYSGSKKFLGFATTANSAVITYKIGEGFNAVEEMPTSQELSLYIVEENPKTTKTFDLSTLNLSAGTHTITVKARASGYGDSPASDAVSYGGDTVQVSGTYYWNETVTFTDEISQAVSCKYGNTQLVRISTAKNVGVQDGNGDYIAVWGLWYTDSSSAFQAYVDTKGWKNEAYRTITFDGVQTVSKEFYEWLVANAKRPISGTWKLNTQIPNIATNPFTVDVNFKCNGVQMYGIITYDQGEEEVVYDDGASGSYLRVYDNGKWLNEAYRLITFDGTQYMENEYYELFILDAVFAFTIDGTTYYAKEGMTWAEWVASEYNTGGFIINSNNYAYDPNSNDYVITSDSNFNYPVHRTELIQIGYAYGLGIPSIQ